MPTYVSVAGKWKPAMEYYVNPNAKPGENPVYMGPDRAALEQMKENGFVDDQGKISDYQGSDIFTDPELMVKARQLGCKDVNEYLKMVVPNWDKDSYIKQREESLKKPFQHENTRPRVQDLKLFGGGVDVSNSGKSVFGGFGDPEGVSDTTLSKRAK